MQNWDDLRHLIALAETGSLSAAAARLGVEHATVARRLVALERDLAARLVDRRGGRYKLTALGEQVLAGARRIEAEALSIGRLALEGPADVTLVATMPPTIASHLVAPRLPDLRRQHPWLQLRLRAASDYLSLSRRDADIALRLSRPDDPNLVTRKLGELHYGLFGAGRYVAETTEGQRDFIGLDDDFANLPQQLWLDERTRGRPIAFRSSDLAVQAALASAGAGLAVLPRFLAAAHGLVEVGAEAPPSRGIWLSYHLDLKATPAIQAASPFLADCLSASDPVSSP